MISMKRSTDRTRELASTVAGAAKVATLALCLGAPAPLWAQSESGSEEQNEQGERLAEVIVTANKRSESLKDVPAAISAITGDSLEQQGLTKFDDFMAVVPGLNQADGGSSGHGQVILRGINTGVLVNNASTVSFVVDDVPFTSAQALGASANIFPDTDLTDVERIEVLKGPQGTLYGASALGGLIKIVSKRPVLNAFSAEARASYSSAEGGGNGYGARGSLNIPLVTDVLAVRLAAYHRDDPGYVRNVELGLSNVNSSAVSGGRLDLRFSPTADLDMDVTGLIQNLRSGGQSSEDFDAVRGVSVYCRYCYAAAIGPTFDTKYRNVGSVLNWRLPLGTVTNSLSYVRYSDPGDIDLTTSLGTLNALIGIPVPANTVTISFARPAVRKITEELRFATTRLGGFEGLAGVFFTHEHNDSDQLLTNQLPPTLAPLSPPLDNIANTHTTALYDEYAVFGNLTYYVTPALSLTGGLRATHNKQQAFQVSSGLLTGSLTPQLSPVFNSSESPMTYLGTVAYKATEELNTYARVSTGYRAGGPQVVAAGPGAPSSFKHDTTTDYEVGAKGRWLDGRASADLAIYYIDWKDIQVNGFYNGQQLTTNGGKATSKGVEVAFEFLPLKGLTTSLTAAYNRATMDADVVSFDPNRGVDIIGARAGDTLPYAPKFAGSASADYSFPLGAAVRGSAGLTYAYQGSQHTNWSQNLLSPDIVLPSYSTLALRAGIEWNRYSVTFRANNVTNKYHYTTLYTNNLFPGQGVPSLNNLIAPRILQVEFGAKF